MIYDSGILVGDVLFLPGLLVGLRLEFSMIMSDE